MRAHICASSLSTYRGYTIQIRGSLFRKAFFQVPDFYHLPKVHKNTYPPGCPIVASMDSITSCFSLYIDYFLQPLAQALPSYIRGGTHLIELLNPYTWEPSYQWISLDVFSLYTSIPHEIWFSGRSPLSTWIFSPQHTTNRIHSSGHSLLFRTQLFPFWVCILQAEARHGHGC